MKLPEDFKIDYELLFQNLIAFAMGIENSPLLQYHCGECLVCPFSFVDQIKAVRRILDGDSCFLKALGLNYEPLEVGTSIMLPEWLNLKNINGVIYLYGVPTKQDQGEIILRI